VIAERIERDPGLLTAFGPVPDDRRDDLVKRGLAGSYRLDFNDRAPDSGAGVTGGEGSEVITSRR